MTWNDTANAIFLDAVDIPARTDRLAFVDRVCGDRIALRSEVLELLAFHEQADSGGFLEMPALAISSSLAGTPLVETSQIKNDSSVITPHAGARPTQVEHAQLAAGDQFGRYRIEGFLGKGAMGVVYQGTDTRLKRPVAIKIPRLQGDADLSERFEREARSMASITHRNLCSVYDIGELNNVGYITMAFIDGETLASKLERGEQLSQRAIALLVSKLAQATHRAHQAGVVHRDLKPSNVMIDREGEPVIMDFGLALGPATDPRITQSGLIMGTPAYMAPEQAHGDPTLIGAASDIYSLGAIMYELLTGRPVYTGKMSQVLAQLVSAKPLVRPRELREEIDPALESICLQAISRQPEDRFSSAAAFSSALERYLESGTSMAIRSPAEAASSESVGQNARPAWMWVAAAILCLFGLAAIVVRIQTPHGTLVAEINDDAIMAQVQGRKLTIRDVQTQRTYELTLGGRQTLQTLPAGEYHIDVAEPESGLTLSAGTFQITRADRRIAVTVQYEPPNRASRSASESIASESDLTNWSPPEDLGAGINSDIKEENACVSADGLTLIFNRTGDGPSQLWQSRRESLDKPFEQATQLPENINLPGYYQDGAFLARDNLSLWFASNRPGGHGQHDLWVSRRAAANAAWGEPKNLGPSINTLKYEQSPCVSSDELTLWFSGDEPRGVFRIYRARRATRDEPFGAPELLSNVNNGVCSSFPRLSPDELAMFFVHCPRHGDVLRLFVATRKSIEDDFGPPVELDSNINSLPASGPSLSADGRRIYFCRQREDSFDLWSSALAK